MTTCNQCQHYSEIMGQCRRHPPVPVIIGQDANGQPAVAGMWPAVNPSDWCGDASNVQTVLSADASEQ